MIDEARLLGRSRSISGVSSCQRPSRTCGRKIQTARSRAARTARRDVTVNAAQDLAPGTGIEPPQRSGSRPSRASAPAFATIVDAGTGRDLDPLLHDLGEVAGGARDFAPGGDVEDRVRLERQRLLEGDELLRRLVAGHAEVQDLVLVERCVPRARCSGGFSSSASNVSPSADAPAHDVRRPEQGDAERPGRGRCS